MGLLIIAVLVFGLLIFIYFHCFFTHKRKNTDSFTIVGEVLAKYLPDFLIGSREVLINKIKEIGILKDSSVEETRVKNAKNIYITILVFSFLIGIGQLALMFDDISIDKIKRPEYDSGNVEVITDATINHNNNEYTKEVIIQVEAKELTLEETQQRLEITKESIEEIILGENNSLDNVYKKLRLIGYYAETGVSIQWKSYNPRIVDNNGNIYFESLVEKEDVKLLAIMTINNTSEAIEINLAIDPNSNSIPKEDKVIAALKKATSKLEYSSDLEYVILPSIVEDSEIKWNEKNESKASSLILIMLMLIAFIVSGRYQKINKEIKMRKEQREREFPGFISKFVLLLNSGLIPQYALEKIVIDYNQYRETGKIKVLYDELSSVLNNVNEGNASLSVELREYARRTKSKEIQRFVTILTENIDTGSNLVEKLEREADYAWENRKLIAEEKGRLAESKLAFPLGILLVVMLIIIITPAFMEMN